MPTIGSLTYTLVAKTDAFKQGLAGSNRALRDQKKLFLESRTDAEKFQLAIKRLEDLQKSGKISAEVYTRSLDKLNREYAEATAVTAELVDETKGIKLVIDPVNAALQLQSLAVRAARSAWLLLNRTIDTVAARFEALDIIAKTSDKLGVMETELIGLRLAASEFSGFAESQFDTALQRMTRRIAEAAAGTGEAQQAIKDLGLDAINLAQAGPQGAFLEIADAMQRIPNAGEQLRLAFKLFDSEGAGLVSTLDAGSQSIQATIDAANRLNQTEFISFTAIESANDSVGRLQTALEGAANVTASAFAPLVDLIATDLTNGLVESEANADAFRGTTFELALLSAQLADNIKTIGEAASTAGGFLARWGEQLINTSNRLKILQLATDAVIQEQELLAEQDESYVARFLAATEKFKQAQEERNKAREAERSQAIAPVDVFGELFEKKTTRDPFESLFDAGDPLMISDASVAFANKLGEEIGKVAGQAMGQRASTVAAIRAGTVEALRLQAGNVRAPEERTAKNTERLVMLTKETLEAQKSLASTLATGLTGMSIQDAATA